MQSFVILLASVCFIGLICGAAVDTVVEEQKPKGEEVSVVDVNIDEDCHQPREVGRCFALFYRYAFNVEKRQCEEFIYGGCAGNKNNFESLEDCEAKCTKKASEDALPVTEEPKTDSSSSTESHKSEVTKST